MANAKQLGLSLRCLHFLLDTLFIWPFPNCNPQIAPVGGDERLFDLPGSLQIVHHSVPYRTGAINTFSQPFCFPLLLIFLQYTLCVTKTMPSSNADRYDEGAVETIAGTRLWFELGSHVSSTTCAPAMIAISCE